MNGRRPSIDRSRRTRRSALHLRFVVRGTFVDFSTCGKARAFCAQTYARIYVVGFLTIWESDAWLPSRLERFRFSCSHEESDQSTSADAFAAINYLKRSAPGTAFAILDRARLMESVVWDSFAVICSGIPRGMSPLSGKSPNESSRSEKQMIPRGASIGSP